MSQGVGIYNAIFSLLKPTSKEEIDFEVGFLGNQVSAYNVIVYIFSAFQNTIKLARYNIFAFRKKFLCTRILIWASELKILNF